MRGLFRLAIAGSCLLSAQARAQDIIALEPSSQWVLDYADERCSLIRQFGEESPIMLRIDTYGTPQSYRVMIWGEDVPRGRHGIFESLHYRLTPDSEIREIRAWQGMVGETSARVLSTYFGPYEPNDGPDTNRKKKTGEEAIAERRAETPVIAAYQARIENIELHFGKDKAFDLRTGPMGGPLQALDVCAKDLWSHWGLDADQEETLRRKPMVDPAAAKRVIQAYPIAQARAGVSANVPVRIMVAADGSASKCVIQMEGLDAFREAICDNLSGGFEPALDRDGTPVASVFLASIQFFAN